MFRHPMAKLLLLGQLTLMSWMVQAAAPVEVEDVMGRKVSLSLPASRIVLGFYPEDYLAVAGEGGADRLVGMSRGWFVKSRPAIWSLYVASLPQLAQVPDLGNVQDQSFSIEKTLAVRPDVVILAQWQYEALAPDLPRLEQAGIPVVVVDYNAQTLSRHMASTLLLGKVTGQEARARKMADEYKAKIETITSRIAKAKRQPPRVYIELGDKGPAEYSYTYGKDMWGAMALLAGGDNVAAPFVERWGPIHPEQLLASKPEVILMAGYESVSSEQAMQVGQDISAQTVRQRLQGFAARPGWRDLPAVQQGRLYAVYHGATRSIMDAALIEFMAKAFYPDLFEDLDPLATYQGFYHAYLPIRPQGTFMLGIK
ncbi:iron ABC transporter substrate-binding protein [Aeromonas salmonicida]|uniref:ABC-type transport system periplasmic substrate-binding protein n=2 Tax=Aeromonas salmonicida TaxID=645 RepID=T0PKS0_AERSA|nr:ABC-type transport system periplasmic substrate-binding protein [Aeromonas salmonicida subsp. pectinolytica 34mel]EQC04632.1 ABC-type Fe(III) dicitrate transporter periplasmic binding protein [Aeromonas salmonicida subsp. pectinolytica 34mel]TNI21716.1 iron ABC transporter substrate-binding protein [Aeromonas salmonicida]HEH9395704.1 ABC transporter substrate-binding protein [Aeromonas salmonicida]